MVHNHTQVFLIKSKGYIHFSGACSALIINSETSLHYTSCLHGRSAYLHLCEAALGKLFSSRLMLWFCFRYFRRFLTKNDLNVCWATHIWIDTSMGTVCATTLLRGPIALDAGDVKVSLEALILERGGGGGLLGDRCVKIVFQPQNGSTPQP